MKIVTQKKDKFTFKNVQIGEFLLMSMETFLLL